MPFFVLLGADRREGNASRSSQTRRWQAISPREEGSLAHKSAGVGMSALGKCERLAAAMGLEAAGRAFLSRRVRLSLMRHQR